MQLTRFTDLGLRCVAVLGAADEALTTARLAEIINAPYHHVAKVMARLVELELVASRRGPGGGMALTDVALNRTIGDLARLLEGESEVIDCAKPQPCPLSADCELRRALARARDAFFATLDGLSMADFVDRSRPQWVALSSPPPQPPTKKENT